MMITFDPPWTSPFHVDPVRPFQLVNDENQHLFLLNKTSWAYFLCRRPEAVLRRARAQGVNVIRVALEGRPYYDVLGLDLWPWGGNRMQPEWSSIHSAYWDQVEERTRLAGNYGIGLDVVLYFTLHPAKDQVAQQQPYWETTLNRLGRYPNVLTWEIANEYTHNEAFQDQAGQFFALRDPYHRPVCTSDGTTDDAIWPEKPWMGLAINHTCTSSTPRHDLRAWYLALAHNTRAHGKPAFCNESGREVRHHNDDGVHRRKQGWLWCASGCFWTWHAWDGCEGIDATEYHAPGEEFLAPMARFFRSLDFWRMSPNFSVVVVPQPELISAVLSEPARETVLAYLCTPQSGDTRAHAQAQIRLPGGEYEVAFFKPADGSPLGRQPLRSSSLGVQHTVTLPHFIDDVVMLIQRKKRSRDEPIPGTH